MAIDTIKRIGEPIDFHAHQEGEIAVSPHGEGPECPKCGAEIEEV